MNKLQRKFNEQSELSTIISKSSLIILFSDDGSWILANIIDFDINTQTYEVQDEDDINRVITLPSQDVHRLTDTASHLRKHEKVLAVFPETTSFYRAMVMKTPKVPSHASSNWDVIVKFDGKFLFLTKSIVNIVYQTMKMILEQHQLEEYQQDSLYEELMLTIMMKKILNNYR